MPRKPPKQSVERTVALCYVRRSWVKDAKDMVSPEIQRANIKRICDAHGWQPEFYEDVEKHKSAMHEKNRPGWLALKARLDDPDIVALIANDLSRLHRKGWRIGDLLDFVDQHEIKLILADPSKQIDFSTPHGRMIAQLSAIFDEWYAVDVSLRRKANIAHRKSQNKTVGLPPFGTKRNADGYLIPSTEGVWLLSDGRWLSGTEGDVAPGPDAVWRGYYNCAEQVLRLFSLGKNRSQICEELTAQGYAFRGRDGQPTRVEADDVRRITHNWVEYGGIVMDKHAIDRHYEEYDLSTINLDPQRSLFDVGLLKRVGEQLVARSTRRLGKGRRKSRQVFPLSSLVYCAHCEALAAQQGSSNLRTRLNAGSRQRKYYVHRAGIYCGRTNTQVPREQLEAEFLNLIRLMTVDPDLLDTMTTLAGETSPTFGEDSEIEARQAAAIAKCKRRLEAAKHLYEDGEISREVYLKRKEQNEREMAHWRVYTTQTQHMITEMVMCIEAVGKLSQLWEGSSNEDRNRMAHQLFEYVVYDLDKRRIVDFKVKDWADQFIVFRAAASEDLAMYRKCDPSRTQLEHRILSVSTLEFTHTIAFPQNNKLKRLSTELAFR